MKQIIIGKEGTQPFAITDPNVSRKHAYLNIDETTNVMQLVDNNSTNGTFVYNGISFVRLYANQPYNVDFDTMIQIGPNTRFHIRRLFQKPVQPTNNKPQTNQEKPQPKPKTKKVDISHLRVISDNYRDEKISLDAKMNSVMGLRTGSMLISMISGTGVKLVTTSMSLVTSFLLSLVIAVVLWATLQFIISNMSNKVMKRKMDIENDYAVKYCCPECHMSFKGKVYENILAEGRCPKCKVEYYEAGVKK